MSCDQDLNPTTLSDVDLEAALAVACDRAEHLGAEADRLEDAFIDAKDEADEAGKRADALQEESDRRALIRLHARDAVTFGHLAADALACTPGGWSGAARIGFQGPDGRFWYGTAALVFVVPGETSWARVGKYPASAFEALGDPIDLDRMPEGWAFDPRILAFARERCPRLEAILVDGYGPMLRGYSADGQLELLAAGKRLAR